MESARVTTGWPNLERRKGLRGYQVEAVRFLSARGRHILADETGVGKTPPALVAARELVPLGASFGDRILIVAPKPAADVWVEHAKTWLDEEAKVYQGSTRSYADLDNAKIVVTNYVLMKEVLNRHPWWPLIIYDEAHKLRNRKRDTLFKVANRASSRYAFFLTGTPVYKSSGDLWPLLHIVDRKTFPAYWPFVKEWAFVEYNGFGHMVTGVKNPKRLSELLRDHGYMLRRLKADVLPELPAKTRMQVPIEMLPKQKAAYRQMAKELMIEVRNHEGEPRILTIPSVLALFTRLRQVLVAPEVLGLDFPSAAVEAVKEELGDTNDNAIIFTPFVKAIPYIQEALKGREVFVVYGQQTEKALAANVQGFQTYDGPKVLISSLLMGTSWTATAATLAYFIGYDWSPANNFQAEDRMHRYGQENATTVKYFIHKGTIDEHIMELLDAKTTVARLILDLQKFVLPRG